MLGCRAQLSWIWDRVAACACDSHMPDWPLCLQAALQEQIAALLSGFAERKAGEVATAVAAVRQQIGSGQSECASHLDSIAATLLGSSNGLQVQSPSEAATYSHKRMHLWG